jgi:hypothetical protein
LVYISETDATLIAFSLEHATKATLEKDLCRFADRANEQVEETDFGIFFERLTAEKDWYGDKEKQRARRFQALKHTLEDNLTDLRVIKIGRVRRDIFVVGLDKGNRHVGVRTQSVET